MKSIFVIMTLLVAMSANAETNVYYVAVDGNDENPGTLDAPFATVQRAQEAVRGRIATGLDSDITVYLRDGVYRLDAPWRFSAADSGTTAHKILYAAYPDETPVLSGGRIISNWKPAGDGLWTTTVPEVAAGEWHFRQLFRNGQRLPRGTFPSGDGLLLVASVDESVTTITLDAPLPELDFEDNDAELVVFQNWSITRVPIVSGGNATLTVRNPAGWIGHGPMTTTSPGKPCYMENALAFVTEPGEWHLDRRSGLLTYRAAENENPNDALFVAPQLERLLVVRGEDNTPVRQLHFYGLSFAHAAWPLPEFGYAGIQAGHHGTSMDEPTHVLPGALEFVFAQECRMEKCRVSHTGASGIVIGAGCRDNLIVHCELDDIGGNGIMVGWRGDKLPRWNNLVGDYSLSADWNEAHYIPTNNAVTHCSLFRCGAIAHGSVAIYDAFCDGTRIAHNLVSDMPYTGISIGFRWDEMETTQRNCIVEYNHVHDVMKLLADGGAIYTLGYQPGTVLRHNLLHNVHRSDFAHGGAPNNGIFFDQGSKGYLVTGNIIYNTSGESIRFNQTNAENLTWEENYFGIAPDQQEFPQEAAEKIIQQL